MLSNQRLDFVQVVSDIIVIRQKKLMRMRRREEKIIICGERVSELWFVLDRYDMLMMMMILIILILIQTKIRNEKSSW
jgi:hypothetical protein